MEEAEEQRAEEEEVKRKKAADEARVRKKQEEEEERCKKKEEVVRVCQVREGQEENQGASARFGGGGCQQKEGPRVWGSSCVVVKAARGARSRGRGEGEGEACTQRAGLGFKGCGAALM